MNKKTWTYIFIAVVLLIIAAIIIYFVRKPKPLANQGSGDSTVISSLTGQRCPGITKEGVIDIQKSLNARGCKDTAGNSLLEDGVLGPKTLAAIKNCLPVNIIG